VGRGSGWRCSGGSRAELTAQSLAAHIVHADFFTPIQPTCPPRMRRRQPALHTSRVDERTRAQAASPRSSAGRWRRRPSQPGAPALHAYFFVHAARFPPRGRAAGLYHIHSWLDVTMAPACKHLLLNNLNVGRRRVAVERGSRTRRLKLAGQPGTLRRPGRARR